MEVIVCYETAIEKRKEPRVGTIPCDLSDKCTHTLTLTFVVIYTSFKLYVN